LIITNCEELGLDNGHEIQDYRYKSNDEYCEYRSYQILSSSEIVLRRTTFVDNKMIFGIPLFFAVKPYLVGVFDMKSKYLYFHPMNREGSVDFNAPLTCT
jgi:hypothetical protein